MWPNAAMRASAAESRIATVKAGGSSRLRYSLPPGKRTANGVRVRSPALRKNESTRFLTAGNCTDCA